MIPQKKGAAANGPLSKSQGSNSHVQNSKFAIYSKHDLDEIKRLNPIQGIASHFMNLRKCSDEYKAICCWHSENTASFTIFNGGKNFKCFSCGKGGDLFEFCRLAFGLSFIDSVKMLSAGHFCNPDLTPAKVANPAKVEKQDRRDEALAIWNRSKKIYDTPAERYLSRRKVGCNNYPNKGLRFARLRYGNSGPLHPCLVALVKSGSGEKLGIQRTFLNADGTGKLAVPKPKLSLGPIRGGAIWHNPDGWDFEEIYVCEGLEDGLSIACGFGVHVAICCGTSGLQSFIPPAETKHIIVCADNDAAGEIAAQAAVARFQAMGLQAEIKRPRAEFKDFNAQAMEGPLL